MGVAGDSPGGDPPGEDAHAVLRAITSEVMSAFQGRRAGLDSALLDEPRAYRELSAQVRSVLRDVFRLPDQGNDDTRPVYTADSDLLSMEVGARRARRGIHPVESPQAASELFNVALPIIVRHRGCEGPEIVDLSLRQH